MTAADPAWTLPASEAPPRLVALFAQARERALPSVVRTRLNAARALYAEKRYAEAAEAFTTIVMLLGDRDVARVVGDDAPSIMALATGFRDLSLAADEQARAAAGRQAAASPAAAPAGAPADPAPADPGGQSAGTDAATPAPPGETPAAAPADAGTVASEPAPAADIVPPVAIAQAIPRPNDVAIPLGSPQIILLDLVIDETGRVEKAEVKQSVNKIYEGQLIAATRGWRYRPATQAGRPVKYARTLEVTLNPRRE
jgi:2-oxoglutarate dehydrogenase E2 component (dihydrolipoamide succinyltransferase)